jgi:Protein of unknwon function (DUF3310)
MKKCIDCGHTTKGEHCCPICGNVLCVACWSGPEVLSVPTRQRCKACRGEMVDWNMEPPSGKTAWTAGPSALTKEAPAPAESAVVHPSHYNACGERSADGSTPYEPIKVIESWGMADGFCAGNAIKYILRAAHKGTEREDLEKALWYIRRLGDPNSGYIARPSGCWHEDVSAAHGLHPALEETLKKIWAGCYRAAAEMLESHLVVVHGLEVGP